MFCKNQIFRINGIEDSYLARTIELALIMHGDKVTCYKVDETKGFVLGWSEAIKHDKGFIPFPYGLNPKEAMTFILKYLRSEDATRLINKSKKPDIDEIVDKGWEVTVSQEAEGSDVIISVKPSYLWYSW